MTNLRDELEGLRVQITIDEDGTSSPPGLPPGTVIRSVTGSDGEQYYLVRLDHPVKYARRQEGNGHSSTWR